ncbi:MAG TPA: hypothetical protein VFW87_02300, partial [Pirellulales bacterium]|nr:hypothetical protein [Pirellulales bacterium]
FQARFDGNVLIPDTPVDLPVGCVLEVWVMPVTPPQQVERPLRILAELARSLPLNPDSPTDRAAQHDHYLYGTPKRP